MHRSRAYLATLLCFLIVLCCAAPALGVTASDLSKHQQAASSARQKAEEQKKLAEQLQAQTARLDEVVNKLQAETDALAPAIASASARSDRLQADVAELRAKIALKQAEISATQAKYLIEQGYFAGRVEASYKQGAFFYLNLLLTSQDFGDLVARTEFVSRTIQSSNDIAESLSTTRDSLARARVDLGRTLETVDAKRNEAVAAENKLRDLRGVRQQKTNEQHSVLNQKSQLLSESRNNVKRLLAVAAAEEAESARIETMLSTHDGSGEYHGAMAWPVPGFYNVGSPFGWRMHPILHVRKFHAGIDISKGGSSTILGAAIVAAGSGKVIWAGARGGYGNVVMIDHGNGVVSVYAHQMSGGIKVSVGQQVAKGQRIGTVGSTGLSTGPHLHFEVRVNGAPRNPMIYLR